MSPSSDDPIRSAWRVVLGDPSVTLAQATSIARTIWANSTRDQVAEMVDYDADDGHTLWHALVLDLHVRIVGIASHVALKGVPLPEWMARGPEDEDDPGR